MNIAVYDTNRQCATSRFENEVPPSKVVMTSLWDSSDCPTVDGATNFPLP